MANLCSRYYVWVKIHDQYFESSEEYRSVVNLAGMCMCESSVHSA